MDDDGNIATFPVDPSVLSQAARCYVDTCRCSSVLSISRDCPHIKAAIACTTRSEPLEIDRTVVDSLSYVGEDVQTLLRNFIANESCPAIQRVTRSVFVVRSQPTYDCTLEFIHITFAESVRTLSDVSPKFMCDCRILQVQLRVSLLKL